MDAYDSGISGLDALLTSPAVLDEFFRRRARLNPAAGNGTDEDRLRALAPAELADLVWRRLFLDRQPLSEATRIILTTLGLFGIDLSSRNLREVREQFDAIPLAERWERALRLANLETVLVSADVSATKREDGPVNRRSGFPLALSLSRLFREWREAAKKLRRLGFDVKSKIDNFSAMELRRFLAGEVECRKPVALSLDWPEEGELDGGDAVRLIREAVLPLCREGNLAFLLAPGPGGLRPPAFWAEVSDIRFLVFSGGRGDDWIPAPGMARARNVLPCGPDRPLSHPAGLAGFFASHLETFGSDFHACHSGAVLPEELAGSWAHLRWTLGKALLHRYEEVWRTGWRFSESEIGEDVKAILGGNAMAFLGLPIRRPGCSGLF
jgi:hypothetical protein